MEKEQFRHVFEQPVITARLIQQFTCFAQQCEELKFHGLAAYVYQKLMSYDPENRNRYGERFLANINDVTFSDMQPISQ